MQNCTAFTASTAVSVRFSSRRASLSSKRTSPYMQSTRSTRAAPPRTNRSPSPTPTRKGPVSSRQLPETLVLGLSHHTATVDVRERLAVPEAQWQSAAASLCALDAVDEAAVLSTCNRFEVYFVSTEPFRAIQQVVAHLSSASGIGVVELRRHLFMLAGEDAVWHLLRVSAGLDSLVIGEGQILAQVKKCYELAADKAGRAGKILSRFLNIAVSAGKRVRSETDIAKGAVSISSAAVELAEMKARNDIDMPLEAARVAIVGAGKMSRLLVQHLVARNVSQITIVNRTAGRAEELAKMFPDADIRIVLLNRLQEIVSNCDVMFTSTASENPILDKEILTSARADDNAGLMLVDISVPRNVAQDAKDVPGVCSYNVDDLKAVVAKNQARRRRLMLEAEQLLREEQQTFHNWVHSLGCVPAISKLQQRAESIRQDEMERVRGKLAALSPTEMKAVEQLSKGIINKMLHSPMVHLRGLDDMEERTQTLKNIEALFKL